MDPLTWVLLGTTVVSGISQYFINKDTQEKNQALAEKNAERERQYYLEDRDYNSPKNQKKRLQEAGLNPARYMDGVGTTAPQAFNIETVPYTAPDIMQLAENLVSDVSVSLKEKHDILADELSKLRATDLSAIAKNVVEKSQNEINILEEKYLQAIQDTNQEYQQTQSGALSLKAQNAEQDFYDELTKILKTEQSKTTAGAARFIITSILEVLGTYATRKYRGTNTNINY